MNERDRTKDRHKRRFTPADIRQIRHYAPQCGLTCWARYHSVQIERTRLRERGVSLA
jgi:hypothetical protein